MLRVGVGSGVGWVSGAVSKQTRGMRDPGKRLELEDVMTLCEAI